MFFIASQVTAQDVSTMIRYGQRAIIFLINNGGYTTEAAIHDGPYNVIKNWNYTGLVDALHNGEGKCWTTKVSCLTWCIRSSASIPMLRNTDNTIVFRSVARRSWLKQLIQQQGIRRTACASLRWLFTRMTPAKSCLYGAQGSLLPIAAHPTLSKSLATLMRLKSTK